MHWLNIVHNVLTHFNWIFSCLKSPAYINWDYCANLLPQLSCNKRNQTPRLLRFCSPSFMLIWDAVILACLFWLVACGEGDRRLGGLGMKGCEVLIMPHLWDCFPWSTLPHTLEENPHLRHVPDSSKVEVHRVQHVNDYEQIWICSSVVFVW